MTHKTTDISEVIQPFTLYTGRKIQVTFTYKNQPTKLSFFWALERRSLPHDFITHTQQQFLDTTNYTSTLQVTEDAYKTNGRFTL